ncbi:MAG: NAD(P)-dependent oxidoreductase [Chloroflexi bacterium]|nr:NAD(P)-dependent oxidoreductase [Chloroflexota bacterium]
MRILLTGASGFIGGHLLRHLAGGHQVYAFVRQPPTVSLPGVHYLAQDLRQPLDHTELPKQLDLIVHQAALIHSEQQDDSQIFAVNVTATWHLLQYAQAAGVHTFVHASTGGVYGCRNQPFVESDPLNPMDLYSLTKAQAELAVQAAPDAFHKIVLRYFFPYGVGTPNPIPTYAQRALTGEPIQVLQSGKPAFNPIHISDAIEATVRALNMDQSATINIAGAEITTFKAIAETAATLAHRSPIFSPIPDENAIPYYRSDLVADINRMQTLLNFTHQVTLATGIAELTRDYLDKGL